LIHKWVNMPYSSRFWQMQGSMEALYEYYQKQEKEHITSTFLVCHNEQPVALFDVYQAIWTVVRTCYNAQNNDYGIHLLLAPPRQLADLQKQDNEISKNILQTIIEMLFSFMSVERIVAEPDHQNHNAHRLAERVGFEYQFDVSLIEKKARFYIITKSRFKALHP
ncbi:MAG: GNAT family N-acetyltransferase, partial [Niabella sp.]